MSVALRTLSLLSEMLPEAADWALAVAAKQNARIGKKKGLELATTLRLPQLDGQADHTNALGDLIEHGVQIREQGAKSPSVIMLVIG
jgi:hypothetical protein